MVSVFFRNDDVYSFDDKLRGLNSVFIRHGIPVHHTVIPARLSESSVRKMLDMLDDKPAIFEIGQHGFSHRNHGTLKEKWEFGKRRFEDQKRDIFKGRDIMLRYFGERFTKAFTPPYHSFDENTLKAVDEAGFDFFSSFDHGHDFSGYSFRPVPVSISFNREKGSSKKSDLKSVLREFLRQEGDMKTIGVFIHHGMLDDGDLRNLELFIRFLKERGVVFCRLSGAGVR
jgi:peptidoglycan/xylan/chitin deacetylase (PgdA/CDA1 family)